MRATQQVSLIHATPVAMQPIQAAFSRDWPEARLTNILDDGLTEARGIDAGLDEALTERICDLAAYARHGGADAILFTCSAFGPAIEEAARRTSIPVLKPNEAMFENAILCGNRIGMVVTFAPAASTMQDEFALEAARAGSAASLDTIVVPGALDALRAGDLKGHNRAILEHVSERSGYDALMLGQFSTAVAAPHLRASLDVPVITSPDAAVAKLRRAFERLRVEGQED